jgi:hypothetical protein
MRRSDPSTGELGLDHRYDPVVIYGDIIPEETHCEAYSGEYAS